MQKILSVAFILSMSCFISAQQQKAVERNPFAFVLNDAQKRETIEKNIPKSKETPKEEQPTVTLLSTETQWHVKNVLPSSVIMQHKDGGEIREIALTGTHVS